VSSYSLEELGLLPVVLLKEYAYCPRYAYLRLALGGDYVTPSMLAAGGAELPRFRVPEGWELLRGVYVRSGRLGLHGYADAILRRGDLLRVVEAKSLSEVSRRSLFGRRRHVLAQALAYAILAEETLKATADAVLVVGASRAVEVRVTPALRRYVESLAHRMRRDLEAPKPPPRSASWKCSYCCYRRVCPKL